jgi:molybdate transport system substrate-binding protein
LLLALAPACVSADERLMIAVASNFAATAGELAARFGSETGISVRLSNGSTGKLYAQIVNGAPYDVFLAADRERPRLLEASGCHVAGARSTQCQHVDIMAANCRQSCQFSPNAT